MELPRKIGIFESLSFFTVWEVSSRISCSIYLFSLGITRSRLRRCKITPHVNQDGGVSRYFSLWMFFFFLLFKNSRITTTTSANCKRTSKMRAKCVRSIRGYYYFEKFRCRRIKNQLNFRQELLQNTTTNFLNLPPFWIHPITQAAQCE